MSWHPASFHIINFMPPQIDVNFIRHSFSRGGTKNGLDRRTLSGTMEMSRLRKGCAMLEQSIDTLLIKHMLRMWSTPHAASACLNYDSTPSWISCVKPAIFLAYPGVCQVLSNQHLIHTWETWWCNPNRKLITFNGGNSMVLHKPGAVLIEQLIVHWRRNSLFFSSKWKT